MWDVRKPSRPAQEYRSGGENFIVDYSPDGNYIAMGYVCCVCVCVCTGIAPNFVRVWVETGRILSRRLTRRPSLFDVFFGGGRV